MASRQTAQTAQIVPRHFRQGGWAGRLLLSGIFLAGVVFLWAGLHEPLARQSLETRSRQRLLICAQSGRSFSAELAEGIAFPAFSPYSKSHSAYPAELCWWTADGQVAAQPTAVLLNRYRNLTEPTFCPACGRLVRLRNPGPVAGRPPPTRQQYSGQGLGVE